MTCLICNGDMVGDGYSMPLHCEFVDCPDDLEPDVNPVYCTDTQPPSQQSNGQPV